MISDLHADHVDTTGAYWPKYLVLKELFDKGMLNDLPEEYKPKKEGHEVAETIQGSQEVHTTIVDNVEGASNSWKTFLKEIIAEEKSKLNIK